MRYILLNWLRSKKVQKIYVAGENMKSRSVCFKCEEHGTDGAGFSVSRPLRIRNLIIRKWIVSLKVAGRRGQSELQPHR